MFKLNDTLNSADWKLLDLPHDWSIEGPFDPENPAGVGGGALPGGVGWYKKTFRLDEVDRGKQVFIQFDGIYQNSTVWINGINVGNRPYGYISFDYELTPHVVFGDKENVILVKADNSEQPNSRWYSGSGIYRNVRLVMTNPLFIPQWGTYVTTPSITEDAGTVNVETTISNKLNEAREVIITSKIVNEKGVEVGRAIKSVKLSGLANSTENQQIMVSKPALWSIDQPALYKVITSLEYDGGVKDIYETTFGFRTFRFDREQGFFLNGKPMKIKGVCLHHDLGALGAAFNRRAMERQLEIMKDMGINAIRTSHNPPAPEVLELCDRMGIMVMDEIFDMWSKGKTQFDYSRYWEEWHERDLTDFIKRDRNHPSIIVWSIGNELMEQYDHSDSTGGIIARELAATVRRLDPTRPVVAATNDTHPENSIIRHGGLDLVGLNYHHEEYPDFLSRYSGRTFIATETNSALATRGYYDMPSDSIRKWPIKWDEPFTDGNPDHTVSAYDHVHAPWGSTQEATWKIVKKHDFLSGLFIWTGFDYLGEPTPYLWPSRSSYFGIVDLAGFPKDTYYMYKSEWTDDTVLHVFPHWNWQPGQEVDVWAYYNHADEVELLLNGRSLGIRSKEEENLHVWWRVAFEPGTLQAVSRKKGVPVKTKEISTAGEPYQILLIADRDTLRADGEDLSFVTVKIVDKNGGIVPRASNEINFSVNGTGKLRAVDNGDPTSDESFVGNTRKAFHGLCLAIVQSTRQGGRVRLSASSEGLVGSTIEINTLKEN